MTLNGALTKVLLPSSRGIQNERCIADSDLQLFRNHAQQILPAIISKLRLADSICNHFETMPIRF